MKKLFVVLAAVATIGLTGNAFAQDNAGDDKTTQIGASTGRTGFGIGAAAMISGPAGPSFTYDAGAWHVDGIVAVQDFGDTEITAGARFMYVLNRSDDADFSVGGGAGLFANGQDLFFLEGGAQIRAFIVSNVALTANLGLAVIIGDDDTNFATPAQLQGTLGMTYFFF